MMTPITRHLIMASFIQMCWHYICHLVNVFCLHNVPTVILRVQSTG